MFMIKTLNLISFTYLQGEPEKTDENVTTVYSPFPLVFPCLEKMLFQLQLFFRTCENHHHKYIRYYQCFHYSLFFITPHTFVPHRKHIHVQIRQTDTVTLEIIRKKIRKLQIIQGFKGLKDFLSSVFEMSLVELDFSGPSLLSEHIHDTGIKATQLVL